MTIVLERSTVAAVASFRDEAGELITQSVIKGTLADGDGNVSNSRSNIDIFPANTVNVVLSDAGLAMMAGHAGRRQVGIRALYDGTLGDDLPVVGVLEFTVPNGPRVSCRGAWASGHFPS